MEKKALITSTDITADGANTKINGTNNKQVKMDLYEYERKHVSKANYTQAKTVIVLVVVLIGVVMFSCLLDVVLKAYELNEYFGYVVGAAALILLIFAYVVPVIKISKLKSFKTDVTKYNASKAKRYNKQMRRQIAEKFIDYNKNVENGSCYSSQKVDALEVALGVGDDDMLKAALTDIYNTDVKKMSRDIILKSAMRAGGLAMISQSETADAALVTVVNLQMIKDILFIYGYRPTYPQLLKIYNKVLIAALVSLGVGNASSLVGNAVGGLAKGLGAVGSLVSTLVDSAVQGLSNGTTTAIIGFKARSIMVKEYRLQELLDNIDSVDSPEAVKEVTDELSKSLKNIRKSATTASQG